MKKVVSVFALLGIIIVGFSSCETDSLEPINYSNNKYDQQKFTPDILATDKKDTVSLGGKGGPRDEDHN